MASMCHCRTHRKTLPPHPLWQVSLHPLQEDSLAGPHRSSHRDQRMPAEDLAPGAGAGRGSGHSKGQSPANGAKQVGAACAHLMAVTAALPPTPAGMAGAGRPRSQTYHCARWRRCCGRRSRCPARAVPAAQCHTARTQAARETAGQGRGPRVRTRRSQARCACARAAGCRQPTVSTRAARSHSLPAMVNTAVLVQGPGRGVQLLERASARRAPGHRPANKPLPLELWGARPRVFLIFHHELWWWL